MDEFQETLQRWLAGHDNRGPGVSAGGFCDMAMGGDGNIKGGVYELTRGSSGLHLSPCF